MVANNTARPSANTVMDKLGEQAPHLAEQCYMERDWIWYCGPSLQKKEADRTILKALGFRWCKNGHPMGANDEAGQPVIGSWGHSCQRPMFGRRKEVQPHKRPLREQRTLLDELREAGL